MKASYYLLPLILQKRGFESRKKIGGGLDNPVFYETVTGEAMAVGEFFGFIEGSIRTTGVFLHKSVLSLAERP
jgi:hypothetical protein